MRSRIRIALAICVSSIAACAFGLLAAGQAFAATLESGTTALLAIYGNPSVSEEAGKPIGGGLAMNFGFGENMLFQADHAVNANETNVSITVGGLVSSASDSYVGATLMGNKTGENKPLDFVTQFVDFQENKVGTVSTEAWSDTNDRAWIGWICAPATAASTCRVDPNFTQGSVSPGLVMIQDVSVQIGPASAGITVQGTAWGTWINGTSTVPACIELKLPPAAAAADQTLEVTKTTGAFPAVGTKISAITGKLCLVSANNDYPPTTNVITIANT
jgi:hypothetical protein